MYLQLLVFTWPNLGVGILVQHYDQTAQT